MAREQPRNKDRVAAMRRLLRSYLTSVWMPTALAVFLLGGFLTLEVVPGPVWLIDFFLILFVISLCVLLVASIHQFYKSSWQKGLLSLFFFLGVGTASFIPLTYLSWFGHWKDPFGRYIVIPPDMVVEMPRDMKAPPNEVAKDADGLEFAKTLSTAHTASTDTSVFVDLKIMNNFAGANRGLLLRHLASSAKWFVTEEFGEVYAYRRIVTKNGRWEDSLNGYYWRFDFDSWRDRYFQFRIVIGLDGPVFNEHRQDVATDVAVGSGKAKLKLGKSVNRQNESYLVIRSDGPALEIYQDTEPLSRTFTALALSKIEAELTALWRSGMARARGFDPALMPLESVKRDGSEIYIVSKGGSANYHVYAYANPGEAGRTYLKVFEATENIRLSEERIARKSIEYVGWSDDPTEAFLYHSLITVYEGDSYVYYPARFELWFAPASGDPERKLMEKIFKIAGFER